MKEASPPPADTALMRKPGPKGRAILAVFVAVLTLVVALSIASAAPSGGWPTTCVALNDIIEANRGNLDKVGIYQRVHGDQAEQACQNDHGPEVRAAFAWVGATPAVASIETQAPISTPTPNSSIGGLPSAPRDLRVESSGGGYVVRAHPPANDGGLPLLGYRWSVTGATARSGEVRSPSGGFEIQIDRLRPGDHEVTLIAYNSIGDSPPAATRFSTPVCRMEIDLIEDDRGSVLLRATNPGNQVISSWRADYLIHGSDQGTQTALGSRVAVGQTETLLLWYRSPSNLGRAPDIELLDNGYPRCGDE